MRAGAFLAALALVAAPATAQQAEPEQGPKPGRVWKGTLGDAAITACFVEDRPGIGVFYADAALAPVRLEAESETAPHTLREMQGYDDPTGAVWNLTVSEDSITGTWRKGEEAVPIRLTAQAAARPDYGSSCETAAFLDPVLAGGTVTSKRESLEGTAYTVLEYAGPQRSGLEYFGAATIALDPARPGDAAINAALAKALPDGTASHPAGQCLAGSLSWSSGQGDYGHFIAPELITPRWLGVGVSGSSFCGGAHPNHFIIKQVFDRESGSEADPSAWFKPGALVFYDWEPEPGRARPIAGLSPALTKALIAQAPLREAGDECGEIVGEGASWDIGLTRKGPVFVPQLPHVIFACTEEIVLPWKEVRPFLSSEGLAVMESLR
jgi:hypothetical protein